MTLEILIRGGVGSDDFLSEDDNKGDLTTLFVFLYSIMMKELRGSQNNRKKKIAQNPEGTYGRPGIQMQLSRSDI